ncbi:hypothetical protein HYZ97_03690, partial [Candidatus Pacearchaeota archaeon]|nr:hypothetical protein [Candidatus Pacearchaeota archaeon]
FSSLFFLALLVSFISFVSANTYIIDLGFTVSEGVFTTGERIEFVGSAFFKNYSSNGTQVTSGRTALPGVTVNLTLRNATENLTLYNFTTDSLGVFRSRSDYSPAALLISAPNSSGTYYLRASYLDPENTTWSSEVSLHVVNQTIDRARVSMDSSTYNPSDSMTVLVESYRELGDRIVFVNNVTVNGSIRNVTSKAILSSFECTTASNGKCTASISAPSTYGTYLVEVNDYKSFATFRVIPFTAFVYMKDETGKSVKNTFSRGEQASVEASVVTNASNDVYTFSGYIADSDGNVVKTINETNLAANSSYTNKFLFTVDSTTFTFGTYYAQVSVSKQNGGTIVLTTAFEVKDWTISVKRRDTDSGFAYDYNAFTNKSLYFEAYPTYRGNGSIIANINSTSFMVNLTDKLGNTLANTNISWNATCAKTGCYQSVFSSPNITGQYSVLTTLSYEGSIQTSRTTLYVVNSVMSAQSTNVEGSIKELFGSNEFIYLALQTYNATARSLNVTDAEIFSVTYMNSTESNYTNVSSFTLVNASNAQFEWAWNASSQLFKLDVPKAGGVYAVSIFAENRTIATSAKFVVNPYDICASPKNTPGTVSTSLGSYYYVWQFKTTDKVYFELKVIQASNPLGKASASNFTSGGNGTANYGKGNACSVDTQTQQVVSNATVTVVKVVNTNNGVTYALNTTDSVCAASDTSGGYTCTVTAASKWDGGTYAVEMLVTGQDGSSDLVHGLFEARAFYLYGYSSNWQNSPDSNLSLTVRMYEAGTNWWGNYGSGGLSGTVKAEKIEYMGKDGEWVWPPVDSGYNSSLLNTTTLTTGTGSLTLPVSGAKGSKWQTGNYRIILKGTDASGNIDYGYVWFSVRQWDAYGMPADCGASSCNHKSYFNSKENI